MTKPTLINYTLTYIYVWFVIKCSMNVLTAVCINDTYGILVSSLEISIFSSLTEQLSVHQTYTSIRISLKNPPDCSVYYSIQLNCGADSPSYHWSLC